MTRRDLLGRTAGLLAGYKLSASKDVNSKRAEIDAILAGIQLPFFPERNFDIVKYGAVADSKTKCTDAMNRAINVCSAAGVGRVVIPAGTFLTGAIHLESDVNLHLEDGATLLFSTDPKDYPLVFTRYEGTECMNYSPFIYAFEKQNIAVTGKGVLDGQASKEHWWPWARKAVGGVQKDRDALVRMGNEHVPVKDRIFGAGHYLRPNFVQPHRCKNVLLESFKMKNSPMWELNPVLCENVTVRDIHINSHD